MNCGQTHLSNPKLQETKGLASIHQGCRKAQISRLKSFLAADVTIFGYPKILELSETEAGRMYLQSFIGVHEKVPFESKGSTPSQTHAPC